MMENLRAGANNIVIKVIFILIILSFIFAGIGSYVVGNKQNYVAKVDDHKISKEEFESAYQNQLKQMQSQMGNYFQTQLENPSYEKQIKLQVINELINNYLLEENAKKNGMVVTNSQIKDAILKMPEFSKNGVFDNQTYRNLIQRAGLTPDEFAQYIKKSLLSEQYLKNINSSEFNLPGDAHEIYNYINQIRLISTSQLNNNEIKKNIKISDQNILKYYNSNKKDFTEPRKFTAAYIEVEKKNASQNMVVSNEEIQKFYEKNKSQYIEPREIKISYIFVTKKDIALEIEKKLSEKQDFQKLEEQYSQDKFSKSHTLSNWISKGDLPAASDKAAFNLNKIGEFSKVIKVSNGYQIIRLDDIKPEKTKSLEKVKSEINEIILADKVDKKIVEQKQLLSNLSFSNPKNLESASKKLGLPIETTKPFDIDNIPPSILSNGTKKALLSSTVLKSRLNSNVIQLPNGNLIVFRLTKVESPKVINFNLVKTKIKSILFEQALNKKSDKLAQDYVKELNDDKKSLKFNTPIEVSRHNINASNQKLVEASFNIAEKGKYSYYKNNSGTVFIIKLNNIIYPKGNINSLDEISNSLVNVRNNINQASLITALREKAKIEVKNIN